jgi:hypothetical protein
MTGSWPFEADDADILEQSEPDDEAPEPTAVAEDAPEADAVEQQRDAGIDEDDYRP